MRTASALLLVLAAAAAARAAEEKLACPMGREYYLYAADDVAAQAPPRTRWLVVGVHGHRGNGKGASGLAGWTGKGNTVVVGPSFPDGYQGLAHDTDKQLIGIFAELKKRFRLHPKMFVYGFSGGSQFAHRFALKHPGLVVGCSAHSGGSWEKQADPAAAGIPFALSCGENDTGKSVPASPLGRLDWFKDFVGTLNAGPFTFKARTWPGVGHGKSPGSAQLTEECFRLSTTGMHEPQRREAEAEIDAIEAEVAGGRFAAALARIRGLPKWSPKGAAAAATGGSTVPGVKEDASGWRMSPAGTKALEVTRTWFLQRSAADLTARVEAAALERIDAIVADRPADAAARLETLARDCKSLAKVKAAAVRAKGRLAPAK